MKSFSKKEILCFKNFIATENTHATKRIIKGRRVKNELLDKRLDKNIFQNRGTGSRLSLTQLKQCIYQRKNILQKSERALDIGRRRYGEIKKLFKNELEKKTTYKNIFKTNKQHMQLLTNYKRTLSKTCKVGITVVALLANMIGQGSVTQAAITAGSISINGSATYASSTSVTLSLAAMAESPMTVVDFGTPGAAAWTVPVGVTSVTIEVAGGGGGGGDCFEYDAGGPGGLSSVTYGGQIKATASGGGGGDGQSCAGPVEGGASNTIGGSNINGGGGSGGAGGQASGDEGGNGGLVSNGILNVSSGNQISIIVGGGGGGNHGGSSGGDGWVTISYSLAPVTISQMAFSTDGTNYSAYEAYATTKAYTLPTGDGVKTVYVKYKDSAGNISSAYSDTITLDVNAPTGTISINAGATYASSTSATLTLLGSDTIGVSQMAFSTDGTNYSAYEAYATTKAYTLPTGDGVKTVYVKYKDSAGNVSSAYSDTIILDTAAPTGTISINAGATHASSTSATLSLTSTDGVGGGATTTASFTSPGTTSWTVPAGVTSVTISVAGAGGGGGDNEDYLYGEGGGFSRVTYSSIVRATANGGEGGYMSAGTHGTASNTIGGVNTTGGGAGGGAGGSGFETGGSGGLVTGGVLSVTPGGQISIVVGAGGEGTNYSAGGADGWVTITYVGPASASQMAFSTDGTTYSAYETYAASKAYTLPTGSGVKTVYVKYKDTAGNVSSAYSDTITLDTTAPTGGGVSINAGAANASSTAVTLNITAATDTWGPVEMAYGNTFEPTNWTAVTATKAHTLTTGDGTKTVYIRFRDAGGNIANYTTDGITLDTTAPTGGSVSINAGAANVATTAVTLNIVAPTDAWTPLQMAYGNTSSPTNWTAVTATKAHTLTTGDGTKTVYIRFRDAGGNIATQTTDTIVLDTTAPTGGAVSINAGALTGSSTAVTLNITVPTDAWTPLQMAYGNTASPTNWTTAATTASHTLATGDGVKTVYVRFKDAGGNTSADVTDTIAIDTTAPTGSISINGGATTASSTSATLTLSASDAGTTITTVNFTTPGTTAWTVPADVTSVTVSVAGGGGGGGSCAQAEVGNPGNLSSITYGGVVKATALGGSGGDGYECNTTPSGAGASNTIGGTNITGGALNGGGGDTSSSDGGDGGRVSNGTLAVVAGEQISLTVGAGGSGYSGQGSGGDGWVTISYAEASAASQMAFSTDGTTYSAYETYATTKAYTLPSTQGTSTVYVKFTDSLGNISIGYSDAIVLDTAAPTIASFTTPAYATSTTVSLSLSASDAGTGIAHILLSNDGITYTQDTYATTKSWTVTDGDGTKTVYVKVVDNAGNTTDASTVTVTLDTANPTGTISIPTYSTPTATVTLSGSDANGVTQMQFSNEAGAYSTLEAYATTKEWPLSAGDGVKTVNVQFRDGAGNVSSIYSATTTVDSTAPTGSVVINADTTIATSTSVTLTISATDALSGVSQMQFSDNGTDWSVAEAYATSKAYTLPTGDGTKTVHVRFIDNAGNVSDAENDTIVLDTSIPTLETNSLLISGSATIYQSGTAAVTLSLQNVTGAPIAETVYVQFSRDETNWYGANINGTLTLNEWGTGFASDSATIAGLAWPWTLQSKSETIFVRIKDGVVDGVSTDSNQGTYNVAPVVSGVTASQIADTTVQIQYSVRDADNASTNTTIAYSTDGATWNTLDANITGQQETLSVGSSDTQFTAIWDAKTTLAGSYNTDVQIRVTANDGELLNNTHAGASAEFAVDAKAPTLTGLLIEGSVSAIEAETPAITLAIAGLAGYPTGEQVYAQFSRDDGTTWYGYVAGTATQDVWGDAFTASPDFAWTLAGRSETISVRLKDVFENISETVTNQAAYNIRPEVNIISAVQASSTGMLAISFEARDRDTFTNIVTPTYQYSTNGTTWSAIDTEQITVVDANGVTITDLAVSADYTSYTASWDAKTQFPNAVTSLLIKITADDAQPIKNIGTATSTDVTVDAKAPTLTTDSFLINDSTEIAIASSRDIVLQLQNVTSYPTDEIIQARFSRDGGAVWSDWSAPFASDTTTLGATTFPWTMASRSETLLVAVRDIYGNASESTDQNGAGYNLRPQIVFSPTAGQVTDSTSDNFGKVSISYTVFDEDTAESPIPGYVTPTLSYSTDGGSTWTDITSSSASLVLTSGVGAMQPVAATDTTLAAIWDAKTDLGAVYEADMAIKLTINDNEAIFSTAVATSSVFALDTTDPVITSATYNGMTQNLAFAMTDEAAFQYRFSEIAFNATTSTSTENASDGVWQDANASINSSITWTVTSTSTSPTIYMQARDAAGNTSARTIVVPKAASRIDFKDISSAENFNESLTWPIYTSVANAQFKQYDLYRATDDGVFEQIGNPITTANIGYYIDENLSAESMYTYKIAVTDMDNDVSLFSASISDIPDGRGSSDALPPIISAVTSPVVQSMWAKILWTTDEEADSTVEYGTSNAYGSTKTSEVMIKNHEVIINDLTPNTDYFFKVTSKDSGNNTATDDNTGAGYTFLTPGGPVISSVVASSSDKTATITWNTDKDSDSHVFYSKSSAFNGYSEITGDMIGGPTSTEVYAHSLSLTDLDPGTTYYYYVQSTTAEGNASLDNRGGAYYTFQTSSDIFPPVISGITTPIRTAQSVVIFWKTSEPATSQVHYGPNASSTNTSSDYDSTLSTYHSVTVDSLVANTTYYYTVTSADAAGNSAVSTTTSFVTAKEGEVKIITIGGGGQSNITPEVKDTTPPSITNIEVATTTAFSATITFTTSESAVSTVQYGRDASYGDIAGEKDYATSHTMKLNGLRMGTEYHFQIQARDKASNAVTSEDKTFKTKFFSQASGDLKTIDNLAQYEEEIEQSIESILPGILPPFIETAAVTQVTENAATIFWRTNTNAYGVVSYGTDEEFAKAVTPSTVYTAEVSDTNNKTKEHTLNLIGLKPSTKYHFKVKSFSLPQVVGEGADMTFVTQAPKVSASILDVKNTSFRVIWSTDQTASTIVEYKNTRTGITERIIDEKQVSYHDILVDRVAPASTYEVRVFGYTAQGSLIESGSPLSVLTSRDVLAPKISNFKVDGALVPGRTDRIQTIVSWTTDEAAAGIVEYQEGSGAISGSFANKVAVADSYVTNHVVILTNLKPGTIYQFKITSADQAGNTSSFGPRTIITPQKGESIFDVIFKNFEDTFKFLRGAGE